nr:uncharacterized protein LOC112005040 [Quercus suber]
MDVLTTTEQEIHIVVKVINTPTSWLLSSIYDSPKFKERQVFWDNIYSVFVLHNLPWAIVGDFNDVLNGLEKLGGNPINLHCSMAYSNCKNFCNMIDLGFFGPIFTWTNRREITALIQQRIDRCWANPSWNLAFSDANVTHLPRTSSVHCSLLLCLVDNIQSKLERPFRFKKMWIGHPGFQQVVDNAWNLSPSLQLAISSFKSLATSWNKDVFGSVFAQKRKLLAIIGGLQKALAS